MPSTALKAQLARLQADLAATNSNTPADVISALLAVIAEMQASIAAIDQAEATLPETQRVKALQGELDALRKPYRSGIRRVAFDGRSVEYGSDDEMRSAIAALEVDLGVKRSASVVIRSTKGW